MKHSFYQFVLSFRGANNSFGFFAEAMFYDQAFPKFETRFEPLSKYMEELAHSELSASIFDELWKQYLEKYSD